ncbi:tetratricopeptide repeat protein [Waterburya agarophytonicola K14]|uniref:Tetratricopeptide repeat protein n=1 Tax=Waterburya agarophytonicola KI4 TaxID=2874699 RepID=A0A964FFI7_9CYAN|nr:tetratricopeptide repeat protein [Waterburya agarophytonicola]MCC0175528.1 tetratricopeptide repeat protein [Waterburya agarophytonicola KI4]
MFKLFKNLLPAESAKESDSAIAKLDSDLVTSESGLSKSWETRIAQADDLWKQGKLSEALAIYGLVIEKNPNLPEIRQRLAGRLKQQGDLAIAYEKLATELKNQGNVEQAANYYRQAIHIKAMTGNTKEHLLRSGIGRIKKTPIPLASLKEAAFSFQPLANINSGLVKVPSPQRFDANITVESDNTSPSFPNRLKAVNPEQARDIDWETAQVYLQKALDHLEQQEWSQSALACKQATTILPHMAEAYKVWGNALQRMGKTGEAMSCYAKAVEIKPNLAEVYAGLADIYFEQGKLQQAVKHYQKAIIIRPSPQVYRSLAKVWQGLGDLEQTRFNISKALELESPNQTTETWETSADPEIVTGKQPKSIRSVEVYCSMARQLEQQNEWQQAAKYYRKALDISMALPALPASSKPEQPVKVDLIKPAEILPDKTLDDNRANSPQTQLDRAIKRYYKQAKLQPNSPKIHTDLGNLYSRKRQWQEAMACYRKAIKLKPRYGKAHLNYARVLLKIGRQAEFIREMQLALGIQPKIGSALDRFNLGNALVEQSQEQQAIGFYYKAIVLNPKFIQAYHRMAEVLGKQDKHQQAIEFLKQGIEQNPQDAESFYFLGQQFESIQNWDNAVKTYSKVLQLDPKFPGASQKLNRALAEKLKQKNSN